MSVYFSNPNPSQETRVCPVHFGYVETLEADLSTLSPAQQMQAKAQNYAGNAGQFAQLYDEQGQIALILFGQGKQNARQPDAFLVGGLANKLPVGVYAFQGHVANAYLSTLAFILGQYQFTRYLSPKSEYRQLVPSPALNMANLQIEIDAVFLARDLINTPANDMGPEELETVARTVANQFGASFRSIIGEDLIKENFPLIYHVGKGSSRAPRLIEMTWGDATDPKVTLVGKGVCFDTGGLNIKPDHGMFLMKKDMGGGATALALAQMIMARQLKVRLQVLIPAVENSISGNAFRPSDIYPSRKGLSVEIGNTDAEGRLVLCDALAYADEHKPDLILDFATLTGAARVALGPDLPPIFSYDAKLVAGILKAGFSINDPVWELPLWMPYDATVDASFSHLTSTPSLPTGGAITAALYLNRFVTETKSYAHFDLYAWVPALRPGRPIGGELQAARACLTYLTEKYGLHS